jgi:hypothetical protein
MGTSSKKTKNRLVNGHPSRDGLSKLAVTDSAEHHIINSGISENRDKSRQYIPIKIIT